MRNPEAAGRSDCFHAPPRRQRALAQRREDSPLLARHFQLKHLELLRREVRSISPEVLADARQLKTSRPGGLAILEEYERRHILWVLEQTGGNKSRAAELLDIDRASLWRKLKRSGLA